MTGAITEAAANAFRDYEVAGVPASGEHDPIKSEIRATFNVIDGALTSALSGLMVGNAVVYATRGPGAGSLFNDLAHAANTLGVVWADPAPEFNGIYIKSGASGSGAWTLTNLALPSTFSDDLAEALAGLEIIDAAASTAVGASLVATNAASQASQAEQQAIAAADAAIAVAAASGIVAFFDTKAAADAGVGSVPANGVVCVFADETKYGARTYYKKVSGSLVFKVIGDTSLFTFPSPTPGNSYVDLRVPNGFGFIDNVFSIRNDSENEAGVHGNAAFRFLDSGGTERGAVGYSRNSAITTAGYYPDLVYIECGNPFTTDGQISDFAVTLTVAAGGPYWGGNEKRYKPYQVSGKTGQQTFDAGGEGAFFDFVYGNVRVWDLEVGSQAYGVHGITQRMNATYVRYRERNAVDQFSITTNANGAGVQDDISKSSWEVSFGGGQDMFRVRRSAANTTHDASAVDLLRVTSTNFQINQTSTAAGSDGRLAVSAGNGETAITAKQFADAFGLIVFNNRTTGDNKFVQFGTESSYTARGSITYNRAGSAVAYNTTSDYRAKEDKGAIVDAIGRLMALRPITARMHGASIDIETFIAHELQEVLPYAVTGEKDAVQTVKVYEERIDEATGESVSVEIGTEEVPDYQGIDRSAIVPLLVAALQEVVLRVEAIEATAARRS